MNTADAIVEWMPLFSPRLACHAAHGAYQHNDTGALLILLCEQDTAYATRQWWYWQLRQDDGTRQEAWGRHQWPIEPPLLAASEMLRGRVER